MYFGGGQWFDAKKAVTRQIVESAPCWHPAGTTAQPGCGQHAGSFREKRFDNQVQQADFMQAKP